MNRWALPHYRCPLSGEALELHVFEEREIEPSDEQRARARAAGLPDTVWRQVRSGFLVAPTRKFYYPIIRSVPVLLDFDNPAYDLFDEIHGDRRDEWKAWRRPVGKSRPGELLTQKSFTAEWNGLKDDELTFTYSHAEREDFIRMELGGVPAELPAGHRTLDIGCGFGLESRFLANVTGRVVFGIDLNLSLFHAPEELLADPLANLAIASAFAPPFEKGAFDLVYSHGVLHHTYHTRRAFESVIRFKKSDAPIVIWVYALEDPNRGKMKKKIGYLMELFWRPKLAAMPAPLQGAIIRFLAWRHFRSYRKTGLKRDDWKFKNSVHSMRDRWTPRYAHRHSFHEVISWFLERGMKYELLDPIAYRAAFQRNLIGIAIRGTEPPGASGDSRSDGSPSCG